MWDVRTAGMEFRYRQADTAVEGSSSRSFEDIIDRMPKLWGHVT